MKNLKEWTTMDCGNGDTPLKGNNPKGVRGWEDREDGREEVP